MVEYTRYYDRFITCDFCGASTRGRIWENDPNKIKCGACHHVLSEKGNDIEKSANNIGTTRNRKNNNAVAHSRRRTSSWNPS